MSRILTVKLSNSVEKCDKYGIWYESDFWAWSERKFGKIIKKKPKQGINFFFFY